MAGGIVGGMFGGPLGAQLGSQIGGGIGNMLEGLISQHGQSNVQGAMNNNMLGSLVGQLGQAIQCAPGIPQFAKDEMCQALQDVQQSCPQEPTPPGCQQDTDNAMSGLIDKIIDKVVDKIMQKLQGGGGCENGGSFKDMVREAIEEVVREKIGGDEGGGCHADGAAGGDATSGAGGSTSTNNSSESEGSTTCPAPMPSTEDDSEDAKKARSGNWLVALAQAMSDISGKHLKGMMDAQRRMEASSPEDSSNLSDKQKDQNGKDFIKAQGEFQAESKLFGMATEATSTALKSIGDGLASLARKQ